MVKPLIVAAALLATVSVASAEPSPRVKTAIGLRDAFDTCVRNAFHLEDTRPELVERPSPHARPRSGRSSPPPPLRSTSRADQSQRRAPSCTLALSSKDIKQTSNRTCFEEQVWPNVRWAGSEKPPKQHLGIGTRVELQ